MNKRVCKRISVIVCFSSLVPTISAWFYRVLILIKHYLLHCTSLSFGNKSSLDRHPWNHEHPVYSTLILSHSRNWKLSHPRLNILLFITLIIMSLTERAISVGEQLRCYYQRIRWWKRIRTLVLRRAVLLRPVEHGGTDAGTDAGTGTWMRVGASDTSSRTNASAGLWMPAGAERQQRCNRDQWQGYWSL